MTAALRPRHWSMRGRPPRPWSMATVRLSGEQRAVLEEICLGVFTDMTNSGASFSDALLAIYLTGAENAQEAMKGSQ